MPIACTAVSAMHDPGFSPHSGAVSPDGVILAAPLSVRQEDDRRTWIAIAISIACLLPAQAAQPAPAVGPREAVEGAVGRFMTIVQAKGSASVNADRSDQIR